MTTKVDGTNGVLQSYDYQVLTTGFSYTFAAGTTTLIANPAGTLATGTVTMPAAPGDGMVVTIESTQQVTALTVAANTGQSLVGAPTQLVPNQPLSFVYRLTNTTWYPYAGGAGRATSIVSSTSVASTSGTSIDFTSIPSWVKRITVMLSGVSTTGTSNLLIQAGNGSVETSGYAGSVDTWASAVGVSSWNGAGFQLTLTVTAANILNGTAVMTLLGSNIWSFTFTGGSSNAAGLHLSAGTKTFTGAIDKVRITTVSGTPTFDAGNINILYE
jgi:hypothetical protein